MKNDENSVNLSRRDFFKELGMIGGGGVLLSAFPWLQSCSADDKVQIAKEKGADRIYWYRFARTVPLE